MEIKELVSYYLNDTSKTLDVTFRTTLDGEDEIREDKINFDEITDFGYNFVSDTTDNYRELLDEDYEDDDYEEDEPTKVVYQTPEQQESSQSAPMQEKFAIYRGDTAD